MGAVERGEPMTTIPEREQPLSEQFRIVARQHVEVDGAASLMEELKTATLEQMKTKLIAEKGDMPDNKAERLVKSSEDWQNYIREMVALRTRASKLKAQREYLRMKERERDSSEWAQRTERKMGRTTT